MLLDKERRDAAAFRKRHSLSYPVLFDPEAKIYQAFRRGHIVDAFLPGDLVATPFNVVLDRQGIVRYRAMGFEDAAIRKLVDELL